MLYSRTHMTTVGVKGLIQFQLFAFNFNADIPVKSFLP